MGKNNLKEYDDLYNLPPRWWFSRKTKREWIEALYKLRFRRSNIDYLGMRVALPFSSWLGKYLVVPNEFYMSKCLHAFLTLKPGAAIDVGTHAGEFLVRFRLACQKTNNPDLDYYGFEPNYASNFFMNELIRENGWSDTCTVFPTALSDNRGIHPFYVSRYADPCSSIHQQINKGESTFNTLVTIHRGDEIVDQLGIENLSVIKIDTEGAELEVLKGFERTIKQYQPFIHCEINNVPEESDPNYHFLSERNRELLGFTKSLDYQVFAIAEDWGFYHHIFRKEPYLPEIIGPIEEFKPTRQGVANYFVVHREAASALLGMVDPNFP